MSVNPVRELPKETYSVLEGDWMQVIAKTISSFQADKCSHISIQGTEIEASLTPVSNVHKRTPIPGWDDSFEMQFKRVTALLHEITSKLRILISGRWFYT